MTAEPAECMECDHPHHGIYRCTEADYGRYDSQTGEYLDPAPQCDCGAS